MEPRATAVDQWLRHQTLCSHGLESPLSQWSRQKGGSYPQAIRRTDIAPGVAMMQPTTEQCQVRTGCLQRVAGLLSDALARIRY